MKKGWYGIRNVTTVGERKPPPTFAKAVPDGYPEGFQDLTVLDSWTVANNSKIVRVELPEGLSDLVALGVPSGVKIRQTIDGTVLDKSYSPISDPSARGCMDLLAKRYPPSAGGGLGAFICDANVGDRLEVRLKPQKLFRGKPYSRNVWEQLALIGCGTGIAPLYQMAASIMNDEKERTSVWFVSCHRSEGDRLMHDELEALQVEFPSRFFYSSVLSDPREGEGSRITQKHCLPPYLFEVGGGSVHAVVCGTDGFLETVSGGKIRMKVDGQAKLKKLQGDVGGLLKTAGFANDEVTKL